MDSRRIGGHYIMSETIGAGGFSKVKLGFDENTKERVALKILKKDKLSENSTIRKQVEREINAMAKIQHENVITMREVQWDCVYTKKTGQKLDVILVVLELATGGELFDFLAFTGNFEESVARTYFHQLINGVGYCHSKNIVHRDLKPENLLLSSDFTLKLADFGFSNGFTDQERTMYTECGTPGYMSPEVFSRTGYDGTAADIWSCGVILFIMLAGFPPFQKPAMNDWWFNKLATNRQHLFWEAHCRSANFSSEVKDFINKVLQPEPSKRMRIADMIKHPWFQGATIGAQALTQELQRRKTQVDENKMREKLEKKNKGNDNNGLNTELSEDGDVAMVRGHGTDNNNSETDILPVNPPSMNVTTLYSPSIMENAISFSETNFSDLAINNSFVSTSTTDDSNNNNSNGDKANNEPCVLDNVNNLFSFTQFNSNANPSLIMTKLAAVLDANKFTYDVRASEFKIKAGLLTSIGHVEMTIQVYKQQQEEKDNSNSNANYVVVFRKLNGDSAQFRVLYADLKAQLKDIVLAESNSKSGLNQSDNSINLSVQ